MQVKEQQLELDMEQQTGSKSGKEYIKTIYFHPACLAYMQGTSCKIQCWMKDKLGSRLWDPVPSLHGNKWINYGNCERLFFGAPKSLQIVTAAVKLKDTCSLEEKL